MAPVAVEPFIWAKVNTDERLKSATMRKYEAQAAAVWFEASGGSVVVGGGRLFAPAGFGAEFARGLGSVRLLSSD